MPSKVSKNKKPVEIEKIEEKLNSDSESKVLELALLNSDSDIEEENPVIERVKNIKQKDSVKIVKDSPSDTQTKTKRENRETERTI